MDNGIEVIMDINNYILVIGGNKKILSKVQKLKIIAINIIKNTNMNEVLENLAYLTVKVNDYEDLLELEPIVKNLYKEYHFKCALSLTETGLIPAAFVNELLGLPGTSMETVILLKNKVKMRKLLKEKEIGSINFQIGTSFSDIINFRMQNEGAIIVKPVDGSGSHGIFKIEEEQEVELIWKEIKKVGLTEFIMEEYLLGPEISVEAFSFLGKHNVIGITDKLIQERFVEIGHSMPSKIREDTKFQIIELVTSFLDAIGLKNGPSHTEIKLTPKGPRIVESHNRIGGDKIGDLVYIAHGIDLVSLTLEWCVFASKSSMPLTNLTKGVAIRFFIPKEGVVKQISGLDKMKGNSSLEAFQLDVAEGDFIKLLKHSSDRVGYLIASGGTVEQAIHNCESLMKDIIIEVEG